MMIYIFLLILAAISPSLTIADASEVKVIVYKGPKKCTNHANQPPTKIEPDFIVGLHFTVTVDESSVGSQSTLGKKIESSHDMGIAPSFPVGQGKVIAGLDQGLIGLCKGSYAYIIVPPHLAYGRIGKPEQGVGSDTTLRYDVEIVDVQPPVPNDFVKIDSNKDWRISKDEARVYFKDLGQMVNLNSLWDDEDANADGYISWEEFKGPKGSEPPPKKKKKQRKKKQKQKTSQADVTTLFQNMDLDKDGKISKDELANTFKALGQEMAEEFWTESDPDGDGYVTFEEFVGPNDHTGKGDEL